MRLLVDTFNVLHVTGILPPGLAGPDVGGLAELIGDSRWKTAHVALVCDGTPPTVSPAVGGQIRVLYSGKREADEILERLIADSTAPRRLLVVSSDRRVRRAARRRNAAHLDSPTFLRCLLEDRRTHRTGVNQTPQRPTALGPSEAAAWERLFGLQDGIPDQLDNEDLPPHLQGRSDPEAPELPEKRVTATDGPKAVGPPNPSSVLPIDVVRQARELLNNQRKSPPAGEEVPPDEPSRDEALVDPPGVHDTDLPPGVIEEAEQMLRDLGDSESEVN